MVFVDIYLQVYINIGKRFLKRCVMAVVNIYLNIGGKNVNIERKAFFASGRALCIGDNSGLGINAHVPADTIIGANVMMGPDCYILGANHETKRIDIPMIQQGFCKPKQTMIEDDVWIGDGVVMTPGRVIKKGSIIAARCVLCKDFPEYSIVGGNPSRLFVTGVKLVNIINMMFG